MLETVKWNGLKLKQSPLRGIDHKRQLLEYLEEIDSTDFGYEKFNTRENKTDENRTLDYPDSEDEGFF